MATTYVGLFRGINVGKAKRVAMADLRALASALPTAVGKVLLDGVTTRNWATALKSRDLAGDSS